jgi:hypothetical protein
MVRDATRRTQSRRTTAHPDVDPAPPGWEPSRSACCSGATRSTLPVTSNSSKHAGSHQNPVQRLVHSRQRGPRISSIRYFALTTRMLASSGDTATTTSASEPGVQNSLSTCSPGAPSRTRTCGLPLRRSASDWRLPAPLQLGMLASCPLVAVDYRRQLREHQSPRKLRDGSDRARPARAGPQARARRGQRRRSGAALIST